MHEANVYGVRIPGYDGKAGMAALVVGDGPLRPEVEQAVRAHGLSSSCLFLGERGDIAALLTAMDVFVLTSVSEGFPFVVLEAMAMERPVVATRVNGVPEICSA